MLYPSSLVITQCSRVQRCASKVLRLLVYHPISEASAKIPSIDFIRLRYKSSHSSSGHSSLSTSRIRLDLSAAPSFYSLPPSHRITSFKWRGILRIQRRIRACLSSAHCLIHASFIVFFLDGAPLRVVCLFIQGQHGSIMLRSR